MTASRWWDSPHHSVEGELAYFAEAGLDFALDRELFETAEVVRFDGELRCGSKTSPATVIYPPAYDAGQHPLVVVPNLDIGRHRSPNGALCLDHPVLGELAPMCGAEAVQRAERLWLLWETDRSRLHEEEADAPDPWGNYVEYAAETAVLVDLPAEPQLGERGYLHVSLASLEPLRGSLVRLRQTHPSPLELIAPPATSTVLSGTREIQGVWQRLEAPPPDPMLPSLHGWLLGEQEALLTRALSYARSHPDPEMPALLGFIYPDEGPERGQYHDTWLFLVISPGGVLQAPRPVALRGDETWIRQPGLTPLAQRSVAILGVGALGSQIAALLARAGVANFLLVDSDVLSPGNRVRHELDLADVGRFKTAALGDRLRRINPGCEVTERPQRLGGLMAPMLSAVQAGDDALAAQLAAADLIVNASADTAAGFHCSKIARHAGTSVLHSWVGPGAWGARVLIQRSGDEPSGCTECLARWQEEEQGNIQVPSLAADPTPGEVIEAGCADPSFTGSGFELSAAAAAAARVAVQVLGEGCNVEYPSADFDLLSLDFRGLDSAHPTSQHSRLPIHPECSICHG